MSFPYSTFIVSDRDVNSLTDGYDINDDSQLATMANIHAHIREQISKNKFGINLDLINIEFAISALGWSVPVGSLPAGYGLNYLQQVAIRDTTGQLEVIRIQTDGTKVLYAPNTIQQVPIAVSAWTDNLPPNVNVIHADVTQNNMYVLGTTAAVLEINWFIPIQTIVADDVWTGVSYALPTGLRVLAYNQVTKGVCVLVRSTDTTTYANSLLGWFNLNNLDSYRANFGGTITVPEIQLTSTRANSFTTKNFTAFKTSATEILGDLIAEPISCTAYTNAGSLAEIVLSDPNGYELLSPNGARIHSHLTSNYVPIPTTGIGANRAVIRNATNTGWAFTNGANLDVSYRTDDPATAFDWKIPSVLGLKNYAVPITTPSFSVSKGGTGDYTITYGSTLANANYVIMLTMETTVTGGGAGGTAGVEDYMLVYHSKSTTGFGVYIKEQDDGNNDGIFRDARFDFLCSYRGHIFCQGSINGFTGVADPV